MLTDYIKEHLMMILTCAFMYLAGIGSGAMINEFINRKDDEDVKRH